jgi:hypothetical protein
LWLGHLSRRPPASERRPGSAWAARAGSATGEFTDSTRVASSTSPAYTPHQQPGHVRVGQRPAEDRATSYALMFAAQRHHGSHQVQERPGEVVLGSNDHVVVHADVVHDDTGGWTIWHGDTEGASGEILP